VTLPAVGYVQQVEVVVGGTLPRAGFVQPVEPVGGGGFGVTLDGAYDFGGAGAGRTIVVDSGSVALTGTGTLLTVGTASQIGAVSQAVGILVGSQTISAENAIALLTDGGTITVDTSFTSYRFNTFASPQLSLNVGITVANAATVYIEDAPSNSGAGTITNPYSLWVDSGTTRLDGTVQVAPAGSGVITMGAAARTDNGVNLRDGYGISSDSVRLVTLSAGTLTLGATVADGQVAMSIVPTIASAAGATLKAVRVTATTTTISGVTNITTATGFNFTHIEQPTYANASITVTNAATVYIANAPAPSGGMAITNSYALWVDDGITRLDGAILMSGATAQYLESTDGSTAAVSGATTGRIRYNNGTSRWEQSVQGGAYAAFGGTGTVTASGPPVAGQVAVWTSATDITGSTGLIFSTANNSLGIGPAVVVAAAETLSVIATESIASGAGATWNGINFQASTVTLTGNTNITTVNGFNYHSIGQPTLSAALALTVTNAATLSVDGPPVGAGAGPATITNAYAAQFVHNNALTHPQVVCLQNSTGDAAVRFALGTARSFIMGLDNSVANDPFVISTAATGTAALGTGNVFSVTIGGQVQAVAQASGAPNYTSLSATTSGVNCLLNSVELIVNSSIRGQFTSTTTTISSPSSANIPVSMTFSAGAGLRTNNTDSTGISHAWPGVTFSTAGVTTAATQAYSFGSSAQYSEIGGGGTTTVTAGYTVYVQGPPSAFDTTVVFTKAYALFVDCAGLGTVSPTVLMAVKPSTAFTSSTLKYVEVTGVASTGQTASTELNFIYFNLAQTVQWATGAIANQRCVYITAPTLGFVGASTVTTAATLAISGAPAAGTNATLTQTWAFLVEAGRALFVGGLLSGAEPTGFAGTVAYTNTVDNSANNVGIGTILFKGATSRNSSGFLKILDGTTARYIPYFDAITG